MSDVKKKVNFEKFTNEELKSLVNMKKDALYNYDTIHAIYHERTFKVDAVACPNCENEYMLINTSNDLYNLDNSYRNGQYNCNICKKKSPTWPVTHCKACLSDYCVNCKPLSEIQKKDADIKLVFDTFYTRDTETIDLTILKTVSEVGPTAFEIFSGDFEFDKNTKINLEKLKEQCDYLEGYPYNGIQKLKEIPDAKYWMDMDGSLRKVFAMFHQQGTETIDLKELKTNGDGGAEAFKLFSRLQFDENAKITFEDLKNQMSELEDPDYDLRKLIKIPWADGAPVGNVAEEEEED